MSTFVCMERVSGEGKGLTAEAAIAARAWMLGRRKISVGLSHFVECYHSCVLAFAFRRECWSFSGIHGFLFPGKGNRKKGREK